MSELATHPAYWITLGTTLAVLLVAQALHRAYYRGRQDHLESEFATGHARIRHRMRRLTRREGHMTYTARAHTTLGWVWIGVDAHHEAMGLAWTRRGARRALNAFAEGRDVALVVVRLRPDRVYKPKFHPENPPELQEP